MCSHCDVSLGGVSSTKRRFPKGKRRSRCIGSFSPSQCVSPLWCVFFSVNRSDLIIQFGDFNSEKSTKQSTQCRHWLWRSWFTGLVHCWCPFPLEDYRLTWTTFVLKGRGKSMIFVEFRDKDHSSRPKSGDGEDFSISKPSISCHWLRQKDHRGKTPYE